MKKLGLDIGTNSIGWALVETDFDKKEGKILDAGCRIIPMGQDVLGKFDAGVSISQTAARTKQRGMRRLYQRQALRRERLHRVLHILDYLPTHYADEIDFNERLGQFKDGREVKLNYAPGVDGRNLFLFEPAYTEMVELFKMTGYTGNIPKDWTLYYLRKKALGHAITKEELAWVLLSFNQKRGYHQLRDEIEDDADDKKEENKEYHRLKVTDVRATGEGSTKGKWYDVILENGWVYRYPTTDPLEKWRDGWIGMEKEFIVTTKLDDSGQPKIDKDGNVQRSFKKVDSEKDWPAIKAKTEQDLDGSGKQLGEYIFDALLDNPQQKIIGKLIRVVQRSYYKNELCAILEQQKGHHEEFRNKDLLKECSKKLYRHNEAHRNALDQKDLVHLLVEDILFYQRPLKSKKSDIADCQYEFRNYKKDGEEQKSWLKGAPRSHPLFQEFRLWQFIHNLRLYAKQVNTDGRVAVDVDLTKELLGDVETRCDLFNHLLSKKEVDQKSVIKYLIKAGRIPKDELENYRWNYVEDKSYPAGETRSLILSRWKKVEGLVKDRLPTEAEELKLWHMIHSIQEPDQFRKGLGTYATKHDLPKAAFVEAFQKVPRATSDYASYSLRALNKLLPADEARQPLERRRDHPRSAETL
jgi:CRISPR-associated endonuclease Csn1